MNPLAVIGLVCLGLVLFAGTRQAQAAPANTQLEDSPLQSEGFAENILSSADAINPFAIMDSNTIAQDQFNPFAIMDSNTIAQDQSDVNCDAFLQMISHAEGTDREENSYAVCYAYKHTIVDFSDHPKLTHEWEGEPLDNLGPKYAGKISTAAGRYQIIKPTWVGCKRALALPDFGPDSQDKAALYLIRERGALDAVKSGNFDEAVRLLANTAPPGEPSNSMWASLPGANEPGQRMRKLPDLRQVYADAGGSFA